MTTGVIQLNEIVEALRQLGGTAKAKLIKNKARFTDQGLGRGR